jgi:membrane-bound lytic murein transglycosylase F
MMGRRAIAITAGLVVLVLGLYLVGRGGPVAEGEEGLVAWSKPLVDRDLEMIRRDTLRVLVVEDPLTWEERPKAVTGLEYELLKRFALREDLPLRLLPVAHPDSALLALQRGEGDVIAAQLAARRDHARWVSFTKPYRHVSPMLATLRPDPVMAPAAGAPAIDVALDTVPVSVWSPFADPRYAFWSTGKGAAKGAHRFVVHHDPPLSQEELLMEVVIGRHAATVVTDARARYETGRFPVLEFSAIDAPAVPLCFAVRRNARQLLARLNAWLDDAREQEAHAHFVEAYAMPLPKSGPLRSRKRITTEGDSLSPFDPYFREHAEAMRWDWQLLAAMAFRESRFDSTVTSRMGAQGIMQIMPRTGARLGLDSSSVMADHIGAAVRYLNRLDTLWMRQIPDKDQRLRFVLASYNSGPGHIIDAQRIAERLGLDPQRWEHHVERAVLLLGRPRYFTQPGIKNGYVQGQQVFHYVRDVLELRRQIKAKVGA